MSNMLVACNSPTLFVGANMGVESNATVVFVMHLCKSSKNLFFFLTSNFFLYIFFFTAIMAALYEKKIDL